MDSAKDNDNSQAEALDKKIFQETVESLYKALPSSVIATIIIATVLVAVLWQVIDTTLLITWLSIVASINISRLVLYKYHFQAINNGNKTNFWDRAFYFLLVVNGLCWSCVSLWLLPDNDSVYHYFPALILIGISAGAVTSLSFSMRNIITYFILLLLPLFIVEIMIGTFLSYSVAGLTFVLTVFALSSAKRINQTIIENIVLHHDSENHRQELIASKDTAIAANSAKTNFISMISHELRTPLNAILGFGQLLKMSDAPKLNEEQNEQTQGIIDSGKHLLTLIEELLELSKIEAHKLTIEINTVSITDALNESLAILNPVAAENNIEIINHVDNQYLVKAEHKRLKQIFINLISNAIKYSNEKGSVTINASLQANNRIRFLVEDKGNGLTAIQKTELFNPFQRFDNNKEGLGLGLYITKNLIELMHGEIGVESEINHGSKFWFELPLEDETISSPAGS